MSLASKITFAASCTTTIGIIVYVHYKQQFDREQIHLGVIRDQERQARRREENILLLEQNISLTKDLERREQERIVGS